MQLLAVSFEQLKREFMIVSRQSSVNLLTKRRLDSIRCAVFQLRLKNCAAGVNKKDEIHR
jgi:hypothetical protein